MQLGLSLRLIILPTVQEAVQADVSQGTATRALKLENATATLSSPGFNSPTSIWQTTEGSQTEHNICLLIPIHYLDCFPVGIKDSGPLAIVMTKTYWDPGNLFQISYYGNYHEIECVGLDRRNLRCKWTIKGRQYFDAQSLLADLAVRPPTEVTADNLVAIAGLCLCDEYHLSQQHQVATRWAGVVREAVDHYNKAKGSGSPSPDIVRMQLDHAKARIELHNSKAAKDKLQNELAMAQVEAFNLNHKCQELHMGVTKLKAANVELLERLKADKIEAEVQAATLRQQINKTREEIEDGKVHLEEVLASGEKAEIENQRLQSEQELRDQSIEKLRIDNGLLRSDKEKLSSEQASLTGQVKRLEINLSTTLVEKQGFTAKLEACTLELQQSRTDVQRGQIAISGCEAQIATLLKRNKELEQNIASCFLHNIGIRINIWKQKLRRSSK